MTRTDLRIEALRCAVERKGPAGTLKDANEFLDFLLVDYEEPKQPTDAPAQQQQGRRR